ncbi:uncharacterized protein LOC105639235 isoform X4 [Jatropha curcas]|uniref:uncharacterized protein LOC105639235 isoform X1 n=1 Tax=Jatropha curcas TaxID=180498 RepID=UPI001895E32F|nr:uncharacterized protein LOC105639235 isoform X1 [Jatropha curcas]XP_037496953.1 uncharacterized protein LOC105639235 isoform X2 [Jatropha curcas]XP_037496954.1 uncharacterized protein LOC105639235 isoform X3 [Jatropha curcas]XP_037496955.1 uncharacterized protein LOC105639235 isoform X4 [Jatropha curcas]
MGNFLSSFSPSSKRKSLPIETSFKLPSPLPTWPPGDGFGNGSIDLGGLRVCQISSLKKVWATHEGGPDNLGASFFEPSETPQGFFMLGCYSQPNNRSLYGWVLAGKDEGTAQETLKKPLDYTLVWSSESLKIKQDGIGYIWLPTAPDGYTSVGLVVTNVPEKPSLEKVRCVQSDLTDQCEIDSWIWGIGKQSDPNAFNVFSLRPSNRGTQAMGVSVGTFAAQNGNATSISVVACLKNVSSHNLSCMPNLNQIQAIFNAYSPRIYFHPDEEYLSSSVSWYFNNGALLYKKGEESNPVPIEATGSNLPQGGSNDGSYWLDLPVDEGAKERVKKGDLQETEVYLHIKPMLGATFTDIAVWIFCPFNGPAKAKVEFINLPLGRIGEHVGDWEHVTLRVSNFNGELRRVFFSQHSGGSWFDASELEFDNGNKSIGYASLHGHAMYSKPGLVLQGSNGIGIRNDTAKSKMVLDTGTRFSIVAAEYLGTAVVEPPWLNYLREWGPKITYDIEDELKKVEKVLPGKLKSAFRKIINSLPDEVFGEEGPTGPKLKRNWIGDEI